MNAYDKWKAMSDKYRYKIIILALVLLIVLVCTVFVMCGGIDKIRGVGETESAEKVPAGTVAEEIMSDADGVLRAVVGTEASVQVDSTVSIEDIIEISELQTLNYQYDAICRVYEADGVTPKYYVAYEGTVVLGVNLSELTIDYGDPDSHVITITIPEVAIQSCTVDAGTLDYIFVDNAYNNEQVPIEAHVLCEQDLYSRVVGDETMMEIARNNTEAEIEGLTRPLVEQFYPDYTLEIVWEGQ